MESFKEILVTQNEEMNSILGPCFPGEPYLGNDFNDDLENLLTPIETNYNVPNCENPSADPCDASSLDDLDFNKLFYNNKPDLTELKPLKSQFYNIDYFSNPVGSDPYLPRQIFEGEKMPMEASSVPYFSSDYAGFPKYSNDEFSDPHLEDDPSQEMDIWPNDVLSDFNLDRNDIPSLGQNYSPKSRFSPQMSSSSSYSFRGFESEVNFPECEESDSYPSSPRSCSSTQESENFCFTTCLQSACGKESWVKEIKVGKNNRPRGPKCWEFLLRMLQDPVANPSLVKWEDSSAGSFRLIEKDKISAIWGNRPTKKKNGKPIKYESFARILRYHYKNGRGMVLPVSEKHLVYKFAPRAIRDFKSGKIP